MRFSLSILGIGESRWTGYAHKRLITGRLLLFLRHEHDDAPHTHLHCPIQLEERSWMGGVWPTDHHSILPYKEEDQHGFEPLLCPDDNDEQDKEEFYGKLLAISQDRPRRNIIIVMGDFNANIYSNNRGYKEIMGHRGLGEMNDNGERFADLCATGNLVIGGSFFHYRRRHKATWVSPDLRTVNQIDRMFKM